MKKLVLLFLLLAPSLWAQQLVGANWDAPSALRTIPTGTHLLLGSANAYVDPSGNLTVNACTGCGGGGAGVTITTVAGLASVSGKTNGTIAVVTDGVSALDCTTGGGSTKSNCQYNGTTWSAMIPIASVSGLGTGVATALGDTPNASGGVVLFSGALGTPTSGTLTNATGLPISTGLTDAGTGVLTALGNATNAASGLVTYSGALGTPTAGVITNLTGTCVSCGSNTVDSAASTTNASYSIFTGSATSGQQEVSTVASFTINPSTGLFSTPGAISAGGSISAGASGSNPGAVVLPGNTATLTTSANTVAWVGPASASFTSAWYQLPSTAPSGTQALECGTPSSGISACSWNTITGGSAAWSAITSGANAQTGAFSTTAPWTYSYAGTASTPGIVVSGAPYTGGSATTNFPQLYINDGTGPTTFSTAGTELGFNAPSGFVGNFIDAHVNGGTSVYSLNYQGNSVQSGTMGMGTLPTVTTPGTGFYVFGTDGTEPASIGAGTSGFVADSTSNCEIVWANASNVGCVAAASNTLTFSNKSLPINDVVSATGAITAIALGNNPLVITSALTSGTTELTLSEATAATTSGAVLEQITSSTTSTAIPVQITQGANGPANAAAPAVLNISAAAAGGLAGASNAGSAGAAIGLLTGAGSAGGATTGIGGVGGAVTVTEGAGGAAGGTATNNGGAGGGVAWATGAGGNGGTGAATAGSGGSFVVTLGAPGTNSATGTAGTVGQFQITGNSPATTANATGVAAGTIFNVSGVAGGADTAATGTAGVGSTVSVTSGTGGAASGATAGTGGVGGAINFTTGNGGASSGTGANPAGGNFVVTLGKAGVGGSGSNGTTGQFNVAGTAIASQGPAGLNAGTLFLVSGLTGGASSGASSTAGTGSAVTINTGTGGTSSGGTTGTGGAGGAFAVAGGAGGGAAGAGAGGAGGAITLTPGTGTAGGATGNGGTAGTTTVSGAAGGAGGATSGLGGAGSDFLVTTGTGGAATSGSTTGRGGNVTFTLGSAGGTGTAGAPGIFTIAAGTVGAANTSSAFTVTNTLNTTGVDGGVELFNTTCTAAAANSKQFDFQIGGTSQLNLSFLAANCATPLVTSLGKVKAAGFVDTTIGMTTSAMSAQTTATLTAITGMSWTLIASKNYRLGCDIPITFAATATVAFGLVGPGTPTSYNLDAYGLLGVSAVFADINVIGATTWVSTTTTASGAVGAATEIAHVNAEIQNGSTAGTLTLDTAANGTNSITVGANAQCSLTQVN